MTLDGRLLHRFSNGLAELYLPDGGDFASRVIRLASSLVAVESCSYNHLLGPVCVAWQIEPAGTIDFPDAEQLFRQHLPEHPLLRHYQVTGDLAARRISDVASERQFRSLGLYRDFYRPAQVDHQLIVSIPVTHGGGLISVALNRYRRDFSDQQREVIDLLRPHLSQVAAIAALLSQPVPYTPLDADDRPLLTPRQTRILQLVAAGSSDRAVARALGLSVRTVHAHLQHIYRALGVTSRTEALAHVRALSLGSASVRDRKALQLLPAAGHQGVRRRRPPGPLQHLRGGVKAIGAGVTSHRLDASRSGRDHAGQRRRVLHGRTVGPRRALPFPRPVSLTCPASPAGLVRTRAGARPETTWMEHRCRPSSSGASMSFERSSPAARLTRPA